MKRYITILFVLLILTGCTGNGAEQLPSVAAFQQITQEEAKDMMDAGGVVILDVREESEFKAGHIPGAVLLPVGSITANTAAAVIDENDTVVLVYCRSGNRSKTASQALADLGYINIFEFGGINTWPYEIEVSA